MAVKSTCWPEQKRPSVADAERPAVGKLVTVTVDERVDVSATQPFGSITSTVTISPFAILPSPPDKNVTVLTPFY